MDACTCRDNDTVTTPVRLASRPLRRGIGRVQQIKSPDGGAPSPCTVREPRETARNPAVGSEMRPFTDWDLRPAAADA